MSRCHIDDDASSKSTQVLLKRFLDLCVFGKESAKGVNKVWVDADKEEEACEIYSTCVDYLT